MKRWTDAKLAKELAFAEGFVPTTAEESDWLARLQAEASRRTRAPQQQQRIAGGGR